MQAGRLRHRVTILNYVAVRDTTGQLIEEWQEGKTIQAEVLGISGREQLQSGAETAQATIRLWVRFRRDVTAASRLKVLTGPFKGEVLNIIGPPIPDSKATRLEILCKNGAEK